MRHMQGIVLACLLGHSIMASARALQHPFHQHREADQVRWKKETPLIIATLELSVSTYAEIHTSEADEAGIIIHKHTTEDIPVDLQFDADNGILNLVNHNYSFTVPHYSSSSSQAIVLHNPTGENEDAVRDIPAVIYIDRFRHAVLCVRIVVSEEYVRSETEQQFAVLLTSPHHGPHRPQHHNRHRFHRQPSTWVRRISDAFGIYYPRRNRHHPLQPLPNDSHHHPLSVIAFHEWRKSRGMHSPKCSRLSFCPQCHRHAFSPSSLRSRHWRRSILIIWRAFFGVIVPMILGCGIGMFIGLIGVAAVNFITMFMARDDKPSHQQREENEVITEKS